VATPFHSFTKLPLKSTMHPNPYLTRAPLALVERSCLAWVRRSTPTDLSTVASGIITHHLGRSLLILRVRLFLPPPFPQLQLVANTLDMSRVIVRQRHLLLPTSHSRTTVVVSRRGCVRRQVQVLSPEIPGAEDVQVLLALPLLVIGLPRLIPRHLLVLFGKSISEKLVFGRLSAQIKSAIISTCHLFCWITNMYRRQVHSLYPQDQSRHSLVLLNASLPIAPRKHSNLRVALPAPI